MSDDAEHHAESARFFQGTDWLSFGVTGALTLGVYLFTLAPNVTLGFAGIFSVGAMYAGVPFPPGFPLWTLWAWGFVKLLPFSNVAWRAGVASAVAGALACGVIALLVSRIGGRMADAATRANPPAPTDDRIIRIVCGAVAGMGFGFDGAFWWKAVIADPWPLSLLLLGVVLCFLSRWLLEPARAWSFCLASLFFGLTVTNSQALAPVALSLPVILLLNRPQRVLVLLKLAATSTALFLLGLLPYLYLPLASMSNPPINWGYSRTVEGFHHVLSRGQFERVHPTDDFGRLFAQLGDYAVLAVHDLGGLYLVAALVPFWFLRRMQAGERRWMLAMTAVFICLSMVMVVLLNPSSDRQSLEINSGFYTASHLVLAVWAGCGLLLIARTFVRSRAETV